jgi:adenine specific DNA methylase Mod
LQELIKIGRSINKELDSLGSMKFAITKRFKSIKLEENDKIFTDGNLLHLKCYIYEIFGDLYMKNQLAHKALTQPLFQSLLSSVNQIPILKYKNPFQYGPLNLNYLLDVENNKNNKPYTEFSIVLANSIERTEATNMENPMIL